MCAHIARGGVLCLVVDMFTRLQASTDGKGPAADVNSGCYKMYVITVLTVSHGFLRQSVRVHGHHVF